MDKKSNIQLMIRLFIIVLTAASLMIISGCGDPDDDPRWFRELRTDSWSLLIGDENGILSVKKKLETMYGSDAPKIKVDLANKEFSKGNWHYEFAQLAEQAIENNNYLSATGYYSIASYPQLYQDELSHDMYELALNTFQKALKYEKCPYKIIIVNVEGVNINAYLVYPKVYKNGDIVPAIIETGGTDGLMTNLFSDYLLHWNTANIAWVGFDIPGNGTSKDLKLTPEAEIVHVAVLKALRSDNSIDNKNIFVYSRSFGGYAALKLIATAKADELDIAGIAAVGPLAESIFLGNDRTVKRIIETRMPPMMRNVWSARVGIDPADIDEFIRIGRGFAFSKQGLWGKTVSSVPLLVYNVGKDFLNPIAEIKEMATLSKNGRYIIEDGYDHCGSRRLALDEIAKFVDKNLR